MASGYASFLLFSALATLILFQLFLSPPQPPSVSSSYENEKLYYSLSSLKRISADSAASAASDTELLAKMIEASGEPVPAAEEEIARISVVRKWGEVVQVWNIAPAPGVLGVAPYSDTIAAIGCGPTRESSSILLCGQYLTYLPSKNAPHSGVMKVDYSASPVPGRIWLVVKDRRTKAEAYGFLPDNFILDLGG